MKITKVHLTQDDKSITPLSSQKPTGDFSAYLKDVLEQENMGVNMVKDNISAVYDDGVSGVLSSAEFSNEDTNRVNSAVDQLETFSNLLNSPEFNPRQIDKFVDTMSQTEIKSEGTTSSNTTLHMIEEEIRMCSFLESVKWKRGDYL
jgi:hypothetical protein